MSELKIGYELSKYASNNLMPDIYSDNVKLVAGELERMLPGQICPIFTLPLIFPINYNRIYAYMNLLKEALEDKVGDKIEDFNFNTVKDEENEVYNFRVIRKEEID